MELKLLKFFTCRLIEKITMKFIFLFLLAILITGCEDQQKRFYSEGYAQGVADAEARLRDECKSKIDQTITEQNNSSSSYRVTSTEVCGGGGVNVGSKHYDGGKTGCVRVYSDGRVEKY